MAISFGLPLVLTANEAAREMISHAGWGADWAPGWLMPLNLAGAVAIVACVLQGASRAQDRVRFIVCGMMFLIVYLFALLYMSGWIMWAPYRV